MLQISVSWERVYRFEVSGIIEEAYSEIPSKVTWKFVGLWYLLSGLNESYILIKGLER